MLINCLLTIASLYTNIYCADVSDADVQWPCLLRGRNSSAACSGASCWCSTTSRFTEFAFILCLFAQSRSWVIFAVWQGASSSETALTTKFFFRLMIVFQTYSNISTDLIFKMTVKSNKIQIQQSASASDIISASFVTKQQGNRLHLTMTQCVAARCPINFESLKIGEFVKQGL